MKVYLNGLMLAFQFFSVIPIHKEIPMTAKNMNGFIRALPLFGLILGMIYAGPAYLLMEYTVTSPLMVSFIIWLSSIILTGAIHLDGWMDASDAFFSYRDQEKRLEIMEDPRIGAFGVISAIILLVAKFLFIYEIILQVEVYSYIFIVFIPFFSRVLIAWMLNFVPAAKEEGLGYYFQQTVEKKALRFHVIYFVLIGFFTVIWSIASFWVFMILFILTIGSFLVIRKKVVQWFGGMTGDVLGASLEGLEVSLWMTLWLLHSFVMG
ncbi:adenosylcobinamide-GDP ribazoletransferase [Oceanobacillus sp. CAU 1775]